MTHSKSCSRECREKNYKIAATSRKAILGRRVAEQGSDCAAIVREFGIGAPKNENNLIEQRYWNKGIAFRYKNSNKVVDITVFEPDQ